MIGIVFFDSAWRHCGLTDGTMLIDSRPRHGVQLRPLPDDYAAIYWLDREEGTTAWVCAAARVGKHCVFPGPLEERLRGRKR